MTSPYVVKVGDNLSSIADDACLPSWKTIYYHPDNAAFRAKRPNPNRIYAGDVVRIPPSNSPSCSPVNDDDTQYWPGGSLADEPQDEKNDWPYGKGQYAPWPDSAGPKLPPPLPPPPTY